MSDLRIALNSIRNVKNVYIEGIGGFTVRKLGAGEELDLSDKMRQLGAILKELQDINLSSFDTKDAKKLKKLQDRADVLSKKVGEIQRFELQVYKKCFEDDNNGKNVDILLNSLSVEDRANLFKTIFNPFGTVDTEETDEVEDVKPEPEEEQPQEEVKGDSND